MVGLGRWEQQVRGYRCPEDRYVESHGVICVTQCYNAEEWRWLVDGCADGRMVAFHGVSSCSYMLREAHGLR